MTTLNYVRLTAFLILVVVILAISSWLRKKIVVKLQEGFVPESYKKLIDPNQEITNPNNNPLYKEYNTNNTNNTIHEGFLSSPHKVRDPFTKAYCMMYDKVFDCTMMYEEHIKSILNNCVRKDNKNGVRFLDAGCGCGRHFAQLKKHGIENIVGIDRSENMIQRARVRNPTGDFIMGNLEKQALFKNKQFSHIVCPIDTLYHNDFDTQRTILSNFYYWLKPNGYLAIHLFKTDKLDPAPMEFSQYYHDKEGQKFSITYYKKMTHKGSWIPIDKEKGIWVYNERYIKPDGTFKEEKNKFYFGDKKKLIKDILSMGFELKSIVDYRKVEVNDHELFIFQKKMGSSTAVPIQ